MSQWSNEHPSYDSDLCRQYAREYAETRIPHHHRELSQPHRGAKAGGVGPQPAPPASALSTSDVVCESDAQKPPTGDGRNFLPRRTPVGPRFRRLSLSCDNCSAPEGVPCQPWCRAEQIS